MKKRFRRVAVALGLAASLVAAGLSAWNATARRVDVLALFAGGFGAGAATVSFVRDARDRRRTDAER